MMVRATLQLILYWVPAYLLTVLCVICCTAVDHGDGLGVWAVVGLLFVALASGSLSVLLVVGGIACIVAMLNRGS